MWVQVPRVYAPELMASSLKTLKGAPNKTMIAASHPVIWFRSPSPWIGPSLISNVELPVFSLVAPSKPPNDPLASNEATASPVGPDGQKLFYYDSSFLVGTSTAANDMPCFLILLSRGGSLAVRRRGSPTPGWPNSRYRCCPFAVVACGTSRRCAW